MTVIRRLRRAQFRGKETPVKKYSYISKSGLLILTAISIALISQSNSLAQNGGYRGYQVACYQGQALNTTYNQKSDVELSIQSIDRNGNVKAKFGVKGNGPLIGQGHLLTGNIDGGGTLRLNGPLDAWQIAIVGHVNGDTIEAEYHLTGLDKQDGRFTVRITDDGNCETAAQDNNQTVTESDNSQGCRRFEGRITNTTYNATGKAVIEIKSADRNGNLTAHFTASDGLSGDGDLTGRVDGSGRLRLSGPLSGWTMQIDGQLNGRTMTARYTLTGGTPQDGNFSLSCVENGNSNAGPSTSYNQPNYQEDSPSNRPSPGYNQSNSPNNNGAPHSNRSRPSSNSGNPGSNQLGPANNSSPSMNRKVDRNPPPDDNPAAAQNGVSRGESINGAWKGTYYCPQGLTNLVLSLFTKDGTNVDGIFTFLLGDGASMSVLGSYKMKGTYDGRSGSVEMKGVDWDQKPAGYYLVNLSGKVTQPGRRMSGNVTGLAGCTTFQLEKIRFQ